MPWSTPCVKVSDALLKWSTATKMNSSPEKEDRSGLMKKLPRLMVWSGVWVWARKDVAAILPPQTLL